jgi:serine/threonine protein kinase
VLTWPSPDARVPTCRLIDLEMARPLADDDSGSCGGCNEEVRSQWARAQQPSRGPVIGFKPGYEAKQHTTKTKGSAYPHHPNAPNLSTKTTTNSYAAPEIVARRVTDWAAADIWSLGISLYNMLTARPMYTRPEDDAFAWLARGKAAALVYHYAE